MLSLAAFCITLPALMVAVTSLLRRSAPALAAVATAAVALQLLIEWRNSLPPPMTTLFEADVAAWVPQVLILAAAAVVATLARLLRPRCERASI